MSLEFSDDKNFQHQLATSIADDVVEDYESTVKGLIRSRKILQYCIAGASIMILLISFLSGILGIFDINSMITRLAAVLTLSIGAIERFKVFSESKYRYHTNRLARLIKKSGLETFGIYVSTPDSKGSDEIDLGLGGKPPKTPL